MLKSSLVKSRMGDEHRRFKDHHKEARIFKRRVVFTILVVVAMISVLLYRFFDLQVRGFQGYATQSDRNRLQVRPVPPTRGLFYDRKGRILAENKSVSSLSITIEQVSDLNATIDELSQFIEISERERERFQKAIRLRRRPHQPIPLKYNLSEVELAKFAVNEHRFDGVEVQGRLVRHYPYADLFTHVGGYVGSINERELSAFNEDQARNYEGTSSIGKIGLEKYYEDVLHGSVGQETIETDARGRVLRVVDRIAPVPGKNIQLHLDVDVQRRAQASMAGRRGAVVAIDIKTGGVLSLLSSPSYDPNLFVTGISQKNYQALSGSLDLPLFNRAIQGQYPPGSTIKPMIGLGGLKHGVITEFTRVADPGYYQLENDERFYRDWKPQGHGHSVDLWQAIVESCDVYYYDLGFRMGVDNMHAMGAFFGLGTRTNIDIPSERKGLWPSREWKKNVRGLNWYPGNTLNMSIGQGDVLTTPLQLAAMTATLARRGTFIEPKVVERIENDLSLDSAGQNTNAPMVKSVYAASEADWDLVLKSMRDVIHHHKGTAKVIAEDLDFFMAGKTGTAQVVSIAQDAEYDSEALSERNRDHALFVGFAPYDDPQIAVAVVIANGEKSSKAGLVARDVMQAYLNSLAEEAKKAGEGVRIANEGSADRE